MLSTPRATSLRKASPPPPLSGRSVTPVSASEGPCSLSFPNCTPTSQTRWFLGAIMPFALALGCRPSCHLHSQTAPSFLPSCTPGCSGPLPALKKPCSRQREHRGLFSPRASTPRGEHLQFLGLRSVGALAGTTESTKKGPDKIPFQPPSRAAGTESPPCTGRAHPNPGKNSADCLLCHAHADVVVT